MTFFWCCIPFLNAWCVTQWPLSSIAYDLINEHAKFVPLIGTQYLIKNKSKCGYMQHYVEKLLAVCR